MALLKNLWRKLSHTKALDQSSGKMETIFFGSVYRTTYITGLSSLDNSIGYLIYNVIVKLMIIFIISGEFWYSLTEASNLDEIAASINVIIIQMIAILRQKNLRDHKDTFRSLAVSSTSPYFDVTTKRRQKLVEEYAYKTETYFNLLFGLGRGALTVWFIFPLVDTFEYNLMIAFRVPYDYKTPDLYPITYILVMISFWYIAHFVMVTDSILQAHLIHLVCQFAVLADCFENVLVDCSAGFENLTKYELLRNKNFVEKYTKTLRNYVEQHKLILSHAVRLRSIVSGPMLGQLACSFILFCFIGYQTATNITENTGKGLMSGIYLGYNIFGLYVICKWCEEITNWSENLGEAIYSSGWESGVCEIHGVRSSILFIMARASKPLVFTAGGMYDLSIASYGSLLKASYSALTVLLRFRH